MSQQKIRVVAVMAALVATAALGQGVPQQLSFTGNLTGSGLPVNGAQTFVFRLFDASTAGTQTWVDTQSLVVTNGLVFATLGSTTSPLSSTILNGAPLWLEVSVNGTPLLPRAPIVSVPYAIRAGIANDAEKVAGLLPSDLQRRVTGTCSGANAVQTVTAAGTVTCVPVGTGDITDVTTAAGGGLTGGTSSGAANLALMSCPPDKVLKSGAGGWICGDDLDTNTTYSPGSGISIANGVISLNPASCTASGQVLKWVGSSWSCQNDLGGTGTVTSVSAGPGLTGGPITTTGTLSIATAGVTNAMLANSTVTITPGAGLTGGGSVALGGSTTVSLASPVAIASGGTGLTTGPTSPQQFLRGNAAGNAWTPGVIAATDIPTLGPGKFQPFSRGSLSQGANVTCAAPCWTNIFPPPAAGFTLPAAVTCQVNMQLEVRASTSLPIIYDTANDNGDVFWVLMEQGGTLMPDYSGTSGLPKFGSIPAGERRVLSRQAVFNVPANTATRFGCAYYNTAMNAGRVYTGAAQGLNCTTSYICF